MIVKESEARDKWCPFSRVMLVTGTPNGMVAVSGNRMNAPPQDIAAQAEARNPKDARCIGSRCMAWRYADDSVMAGSCGLAGHVDD